MLGKTHMAIGVAATLPLLLKGDINVVHMTIGLLGATAPDIDQKINIKHRGFSHSIVAVGLTTAPIYYINKPTAIVWGTCYLSHILSDSFTKQGVPLLWPTKHMYGLKLFKVNKKSDSFCYTLTLLVIIYELVTLTPLIKILEKL